MDVSGRTTQETKSSNYRVAVIEEAEALPTPLILLCPLLFLILFSDPDPNIETGSRRPDK